MREVLFASVIDVWSLFVGSLSARDTKESGVAPIWAAVECNKDVSP